jgi:hypothetical protein
MKYVEKSRHGEKSVGGKVLTGVPCPSIFFGGLLYELARLSSR